MIISILLHHLRTKCWNKMVKTWTWLCFHLANSTERGMLDLWSKACTALGCDEARSRSLHLQPAADGWTSLSVAAHFPFQCWAARLPPTCMPSWHPQKSASACCLVYRTPCSMGAPFHADRSFDLDTTVRRDQEVKTLYMQKFVWWFFTASHVEKQHNKSAVSPEMLAKIWPLFFNHRYRCWDPDPTEPLRSHAFVHFHAFPWIYLFSSYL